jgi:hypothetical protein
MVKLLLFHFEYWYYRRVIARENNILVYPMIVWMEFNKETIKKRALNGRPVFDQLKSHLNTINSSIKRKITRDKPSQEVCERLQKLKQIKENDADIKRYFPGYYNY